jgi:uncharacterized protein YndB with AHSA1/START domain
MSDKPTFVYVTYIRTTTEKLWDALTQPEFTRQYWCETWHDTTWEPGSPWKLMIPDGRVGDAGEIVEIDRLRRLVLRWQNQFIPELRAEGYSLCTLQIEPQQDAVKLTITHSIDRPGPSKLIEGFASGWPPILSSLKSLLETGSPLEFTRKWPEGF